MPLDVSAYPIFDQHRFYRLSLSGLVDPNGKNWLAMVATANAVNYLTLTNNVTGSAVILAPTGDTNAGLTITAAGTGTLTLGATGQSVAVVGASAITGNLTVTGTASATVGSIKAINSNASAVGMAAMLSNLSANNAANAAELGFSMNNSTPAEVQFGAIRVTSTTVTAAAEAGTMAFRLMVAGTMTTVQQIGKEGGVTFNGATDPAFAGSIATVIPGNNQGFRMYSTNFNGSARGWGFRINTAANGDMSIMQSSTSTGDPFTNHRLYLGPSGGVNIGAAADVAAGALAINGKLTGYNNIATAGGGIPAIYSEAITTTQTANVTVLTYTPPATAGRYRVSGAITTTSATNTGTVGFTLDYVDSQGTVHTADVVPVVNAAGTVATTGTAASKEFHSIPWEFSINNAATAIVLKVVITGAVSYTAAGTIEQIA